MNSFATASSSDTPATAPSAAPEETTATLSPGPTAVMVAVMSAILLIVNAVVCATAGSFLGISGWTLWQVIPGAFSIAFVATTFLGYRSSSAALRVIYTLSAAWLGVLNFLFFAALLCWGIAAVAAVTGLHPDSRLIGGIVFGAALLVSAYGLINAAAIRIHRVPVRLRNLPAEWQGREIGLVTDIHLGHLHGPRFLRRILGKLRAARPEAVLISGDMFDGTPVGLNRLAAYWRTFSAPRGVYYVTGNHDEFAERSLYVDAMKRTGMRVLENEKITIEGLQIVGVHDGEATRPELLAQILRRAKIDRSRPSILLAHQPANPAVAEEAGISLQLSGHTHGGQFWPWNLVVKRIYGRFGYGLGRLRDFQLYTSSGVGTWGPPMRVGTRPEIVLLRLEKDDSPAG